MRFSNISERVLGQKSKVRLLKALYKIKMPLSGRHLSKICGLNHRTCMLSLKELEKEGIIKSRSVGRSMLFELNEKNYFIREVLSKLFNAEEHLLEDALKRVIKNINGKIKYESIILYGSMAEGGETADSDIDLAVILSNKGDNKKAALIFEKINQEFISIFGNVLSPYFITRNDFLIKFQKNNPLIREIARTGRVIKGKSIEGIITSGKED